MGRLKNTAATKVQARREFLIEKVSFLQEIRHPNSGDATVIHEGGYKYFPHSKPFCFFILNCSLFGDKFWGI